MHVVKEMKKKKVTLYLPESGDIMTYDPVILKVSLIQMYSSPAVLIMQLTFYKPFLLDSAGPVSLLHVFG